MWAIRSRAKFTLASRSRGVLPANETGSRACRSFPLLPGSRRKEVERILPPMLEAAALISARRPEVQFVVVVAPSRTSDEVRDIVRAQRATPEPLPSCLHIVSGQSREALAASDAAAIASGTATLEAALTRNADGSCLQRVAD